MLLALLFAAVTPFCSCSTFPVVAGLAAAGVPVGAPTAFLVASPRTGGAAGRARRACPRGGPPLGLGPARPLAPSPALVGALLYVRVDAGLIGRAIEAASPWAVPRAVVVGVPVHASTAVLLPRGSALLATGADLGVVTAFLIGATGLSLPEGILLQRLLSTRYLTVQAAAFVAAAVVGYAVQALAPEGG